MTTARNILAWAAALPLSFGAAEAVGQRGPSEPIGERPVANVLPDQARGVDVEERLGQRVPLELGFVDSEGTPVALAEYFRDDRPVILAMVYYDCPVVCGIVMGQLTKSFREIDFDIGEDYGVLFVSIDPAEGPELAAEAKSRFLADYTADVARPASVGEGWGFLTAAGDQSRLLAASLGWNYKPLADGEYSHPVCIFVLAPDGTIARYVYGVGYEPETMRMALLEASEGKISPSIGDKIRMFCFRFDPSTGKYSIAALRVVQLGGIVSTVAVGGLIGGFLLKERARRRRIGGGRFSDPRMVGQA